MDTRNSLRWPGRPWDELQAEMAAARRDDPAKWEDARSFGMVYPGGPEVERVIREAQAMFFAENGRHTQAFPSLRRFEADILAKTADLFAAPAPIGNVLSGGTEAAIVMMKAVRGPSAASSARKSFSRPLPTRSTRWRHTISAFTPCRSASTTIIVPICARSRAPSRRGRS